MAKKNIPKTFKAAEPLQIYEVGKQGIEIYPDYKNGAWFICVRLNGKESRFDKRLKADEINEAVAKCIVYYYNKLKK